MDEIMEKGAPLSLFSLIAKLLRCPCPTLQCVLVLLLAWIPMFSTLYLLVLLCHHFIPN